MLGRILYFLLVMLVARLVLRAVAEVFGGGTGSRDAAGSRRMGDRGAKRVLSKGRMVRDPVCGLNVPEDRAIVAVVDGESLYFCSERCRDELVDESGHKRASA